MDRYIEFNPLKFISEAPGWKKELETLEEQLESISELPGKSDSPGRGSGVTSATERCMLSRNEILIQIKRIKTYQEVFKFGWDSITEEERQMIGGFFYRTEGSARDFVKKYAERNGTSRSYVYNARKEAIHNFVNAIKSEFYL